MIVYYVMLLIVIFCIFCEARLTAEKEIKKNFIFALLPVFILIALKAETIGTDTIHYLTSYRSARDYGMVSLNDFGYERIESGYKLLLWVLAIIHADQQILLIVIGLFVVFSLYKFIWHNAINKCLALYLFVTMGFFQFAMSGIRQTIAICIMLLAYKLIKERRLFYFVITIAVAASFHKSVVVFAPIYFIANMKITRGKVATMFASMFVLLFVADKLLLAIAGAMDYNYGIEETGNGNTFFMIVLLITILVVRSRNKLMSINSFNKMVINTNFIALALWTLRLISRTAERVSLYFMPYNYIALEEFISTRPKKSREVYTIVVILLATFLFLKRISTQEDLCNFKFFFQ